MPGRIQVGSGDGWTVGQLLSEPGHVYLNVNESRAPAVAPQELEIAPISIKTRI